MRSGIPRSVIEVDGGPMDEATEAMRDFCAAIELIAVAVDGLAYHAAHLIGGDQVAVTFQSMETVRDLIAAARGSLGIETDGG